jgi:hypothetical protein
MVYPRSPTCLTHQSVSPPFAPFQVSIPTLLSSTSSDALLVTDGVQVGLVAGTNTDCAKGPRADGGWDTELTFKTYDTACST